MPVREWHGVVSRIRATLRRMVDRGGQDRVGSPHEATTQVPDDVPDDAPLDVTDPGVDPDVDPGLDPGLDPGVDPGVDQLGWDATALVVAHVVLALGIGAAVGAVGGRYLRGRHVPVGASVR